MNLSYIDKMEYSSVGAPLSSAGAKEWIKGVSRSPVPIRFGYQVICRHPIFADHDLVDQCVTSMNTYCTDHLDTSENHSKCYPSEEDECYGDLDCSVDKEVCQSSKCVKMPECKVTIYEDTHLRSPKHHLAPITAIGISGARNGHTVDLTNNDWLNRISSVHLSDGCKKVDLVDDDDSCNYQKIDNRVIGHTELILPDDLNDDVCKMKVWAKEVATSFLEVEPQPFVVGLEEVNLKLRAISERRRAELSKVRRKPVALLRPAPRWELRPELAVQTPEEVPRELEAKRANPLTLVELVEDKGKEEESTSAVNGPGVYIKNIGKGMYGYNHFYGAPLSAEYAGTDPGFMHRPLWEVTYGQGTVATFVEFTEIPRTLDQFLQFAPTESPWKFQGFAVDTKNTCACIKRSATEQQCLNFATANGAWAVKRHTIVYDEKPAPEAKTECEAVISCDNLRYCPCQHLQCCPSGDTYNVALHPDLFEADYHESSAAPAKQPAQAAPDGKNCNGHWQYFTLVDVQETLDNLRYCPRAAAAAATAASASSGSGKQLKVPDGWRVTMGESPYCERSFRSTEVKSQFAYESYVTDSFNLLGGGIDIGVCSFSFSSEEKEFRKNNGNERKMLVVTTAECINFILEMETRANWEQCHAPPNASANFQFVVDEMGSVSESEDFYALFDMFGAHYPTRVMFGARYGFSNWIDEQNYINIESNSDSFTASGSVSKGYKDFAAVSATLGYEKGMNDSSAREVSANFTETKEFTLGRRMPDSGGVEAWIQDVTVEPMPVRFDLVPLCDHPSLSDKKAACTTHLATYCTVHLAQINPTDLCQPPPVPDCLWDLDCPQVVSGSSPHKCTEGICVPEPECEVTLYNKLGGVMHDLVNAPVTLGPIWWRTNISGATYRLDLKYIAPPMTPRSGNHWEKEISSLRYSGGCEEVLLFDEDGCGQVDEDNDLLNHHYSNNNGKVESLDGDLNDDVCKIKLAAKKSWV